MDIDIARDSTTPSGESERWAPWRVWTIRIWYGLLSLWPLSMAR
jgi:hypothetical protein